MFLMISSHSPVPLYQQIVDQIRAKILAGELRPDEPLPSIRELARDLTTSVITTKRAYLELEREGLIVTRPGLGTFVAAVNPDRLAGIRCAKVKERLEAAVQEARRVGVGDREIKEMLEELLKK